MNLEPEEDAEYEEELDENEDDDEEGDEGGLDDSDEVNWDVREYPIRDWLTEKLEAEHKGWVEPSLTAGSTPVFGTDADISDVLESIPLEFMNLLETSSVYIRAGDGDVFVFFDDRPEASVVKDTNYVAGVEAKVDDISGMLDDDFKIAVRIVNDNKVSRVAWIK